MPEFGGIEPIKFLESNPIFLNLQTITSATITLPPHSGTFLIALSADGGTNWEEAYDGVAHTFTSTGQDLRYRIIGEGVISVKTSGIDTPLKVSYTTS